MTVPENRQSVQHCITNHFFSSEVEKHCDKCEMNTTHKIKTRISKNPRVMIIHFQRLLTEWNREEVKTKTTFFYLSENFRIILSAKKSQTQSSCRQL